MHQLTQNGYASDIAHGIAVETVCQKHQARVVIQSNGKPRRFVLAQPPGYRKVNGFPPAADVLAANVIQAITRSQDGRATNYRSNGTRPPAA